MRKGVENDSWAGLAGRDGAGCSSTVLEICMIETV